MPILLASLETPAHPGQHPLPFDPSLQGRRLQQGGGKGKGGQ